MALCCAVLRDRRITEGREEKRWRDSDRDEKGELEGQRGRREARRDSSRDADGGSRAAVFWPLSKCSVASSEQTKYWSQLNITFPLRLQALFGEAVEAAGEERIVFCRCAMPP